MGWKDDGAPVSAPIASFVDSPGGPVDRLAADPDVTTFLNDRFHPIFHTVDPAQPPGTVEFLTADGCSFGPPLVPASPGELIEAANAVMLRTEATGRTAAAFGRDCPDGKRVR